MVRLLDTKQTILCLLLTYSLCLFSTVAWGQSVPPGGNNPQRKEASKGGDPTLQIQVEIADEAGNILPYNAAPGEPTQPEMYSAVQYGLRAIVKNPPGLKNVKYSWKISNAIESYTHDIDEADKLKTIPINTSVDPSKPDIKFFWTDDGSNTVSVDVTADGGFTGTKTINLTVKEDNDPNRNIYCADEDDSKTPKFDVLQSHGNWHIQGRVDLALYPATGTGQAGQVPVESAGEKDAQGNFIVASEYWGDQVPPSGLLPTSKINGNAFLMWHRAFLDSHIKWRGAFGIGTAWKGVALDAAPVSANDKLLLLIPEYLKTTPDEKVLSFSPYYGYVRLGEFKDLWELGRDMCLNWHAGGHNAIDRMGGDYDDMSEAGTSPRTSQDFFYKWHTRVDEPRKLHTPDKAIVVSTDPIYNASGGLEAIVITFDRKVSRRSAINLIGITAAALTVNGSPATSITDMRLQPPSPNRYPNPYRQFKFTGFTVPGGTSAAVVLTGTTSYNGVTTTVQSSRNP